LTEHSGRFGKFGFLADQAKFPPSHGFELWEDCGFQEEEVKLVAKFLGD
jgi:hypothetical protein